jgi:hypothetical protein
MSIRRHRLQIAIAAAVPSSIRPLSWLPASSGRVHDLRPCGRRHDRLPPVWLLLRPLDIELLSSIMSQLVAVTHSGVIYCQCHIRCCRAQFWVFTGVLPVCLVSSAQEHDRASMPVFCCFLLFFEPCSFSSCYLLVVIVACFSLCDLFQWPSVLVSSFLLAVF